MKEPVSTISNIFYIIAGILVFSESWMVGISLILLGLASAWFHATKERIAQSADVIAIFLVFNTLITHFLFTGFEVPMWILVPSVIVITFLMGWYERLISTLKVVPAQFFIVVLLGISAGISQWYIAVFTGALLFNLPAISDRFRRPDWLHDLLHAFWHLLTAAGFYMILTW